MYCSILLFPFLNFLCIMFFGRFVGRKGSIILSIFNVGVSWFLTLIFLLYSVKTQDVCYLSLLSWFNTGLVSVSFTLLFDSLTGFMLFLVLTISVFVHTYSFDYMKYDPHLQRFLGYLSLFTFFMILLVTSSNFIQLFFGWEGVGICSYLLISFWYTRLDACTSAVKAVIFNKFGDCSLLLAISAVYCFTKSLDFSTVFTVMQPFYFLTFYEFNLVDCICLLLIIAAVGKSAQFFLHPWLADAMEGPTPVSALIHAATMVTAGIFLVIRCSFIFSLSINVCSLMAFWGTLTILFSSTVGFFQYDLKKVIAYSTCSQLGYMFVACSFFHYKVALFHLFNHGFFKALLFLTAGLVIHNVGEEQDFRKMGGLFNTLPLIYVFFLIGSFSLMGIPFLTGFYSKDLIIEYLYLTQATSIFSFFCFNVCVFGAFLTGIYSIRMLFYIFWSGPNGLKSTYTGLNLLESDYLSLACLSILSVFSVAVGYLAYDVFFGLGSGFFNSAIGNSLVANSQNYPLFYLKKYNEFISDYPIKVLPLFLSFLSIYCVICCLYVFNVRLTFYVIFSSKLYSLFVFFNQGWLFNYLVQLFNSVVYKFSFYVYYFDKSFLESYGPVSLSNTIYGLSKYLYTFQANDFYNYLYGLCVFICILFFLLIFLFFGI